MGTIILGQSNQLDNSQGTNTYWWLQITTTIHGFLD